MLYKNSLINLVELTYINATNIDITGFLIYICIVKGNKPDNNKPKIQEISKI